MFNRNKIKICRTTTIKSIFDISQQNNQQQHNKQITQNIKSIFHNKCQTDTHHNLNINLNNQQQQKILSVIQVDETINLKIKPKIKFISYKLLNEQRIKLINETTLIQKLNDLNNKQSESSQSSSSSQQLSNEFKICHKKTKLINKNIKPIRYWQKFQYTQLMSNCRNCFKVGHSQRYCPSKIESCCYYCLGKHNSFDCSISICLRCNLFGHNSYVCKQIVAACKKCKKLGHDQSQCQIIYMNKIHNEQDIKEVNCMNCLQVGHINCLSKFQDDLYGKQIKIQKENSLVQKQKIDKKSLINNEFLSKMKDKYLKNVKK